MVSCVLLVLISSHKTPDPGHWPAVECCGFGNPRRSDQQASIIWMSSRVLVKELLTRFCWFVFPTTGHWKHPFTIKPRKAGSQPHQRQMIWAFFGFYFNSSIIILSHTNQSQRLSVASAVSTWFNQRFTSYYKISVLSNRQKEVKVAAKKSNKHKPQTTIKSQKCTEKRPIFMWQEKKSTYQIWALE